MGSPRILVLDDDRLILQIVSDALVPEGFEIATAKTAKEAVTLAAGSRFDLVVSDINLPDSSGFDVRDEIRKLGSHATVPFVFYTAAQADYEIQIAQKLGGDGLLIKPASPGDLRRAVFIALKFSRVDRGDLPDALARILTRISEDRETGVLSAVAGTSIKRVVFQDGKIAFAASNDPREVIGQVFVRAGLISEKDLSEAFAWRDANPVKGRKQPLGAVLTALRKVTPEQCEKVFQRKIRETVLDLFLWKAGVAEFVAGGLDDGDKPFPIALDTGALLLEGMKRRTRWADVQKTLPDPSVKFERKGHSWPKGFPANDGDRVLVKHIESKRSMAEILVELRGQDFAVGARLADLVKNGTIAPVKSSGFSGATFHDSVTIDIDEVLTSLEMEESMPSDHVEKADDGEDDVSGGTAVSAGADRSAGSGTRVLTRPGTTPEPPPVSPVTPVSPVMLAPTATQVSALPEAEIVPLEVETEIGEAELEPLDEPYDETLDAPPPIPRPATTPPPAPTAAPPATGPISPGNGLPDTSTIALLTRALVLLRAGDLASAREGLVQVLSIDPMNPLARQRLTEIEQTLSQQAQASGLGPDQKVVLALQIHELVGRNISPNDAFMLSRLAAGALSLGELFQICPMPEAEIRQSVSMFLGSGVLRKSG